MSEDITYLSSVHSFSAFCLSKRCSHKTTMSRTVTQSSKEEIIRTLAFHMFPSVGLTQITARILAATTPCAANTFKT